MVASKQGLEEHLRKIYQEGRRHEQLVIPPNSPPISQPVFPMDTDPPKWKEVEKAVSRARAASAPGPNGVQFYKNAPDILCYLWELMRVVWKKQTIPTVWKRAGGIMIPKEKNASEINQVRPISLLNVEGKIFFSVIAQRLILCLERNKYIVTSIQKAGLPVFPSCLEHTSMAPNPSSQKGKTKNSISSSLAWLMHSAQFLMIYFGNPFGVFFFQVPKSITLLVKSYTQDLHLCFTTAQFTTTWQHLEAGIMAGCTISPLAFIKDENQAK